MPILREHPTTQTLWSSEDRIVMLLCLFCSSALTQTTKPEHVLLNCLGGRKTTTVVTCSSCNEALGSELDDELCDTVKEIRNYLALPKGDGSPAPMILSRDNLDENGGGDRSLKRRPVATS